MLHPDSDQTIKGIEIVQRKQGHYQIVLLTEDGRFPQFDYTHIDDAKFAADRLATYYTVDWSIVDED